MTTRSFDANSDQFSVAVSDSQAEFLLQNLSSRPVFIMVLGVGVDANTLTEEEREGAIRLATFGALSRQVVGDGVVWVRSSMGKAVLSLTGG